MFFGIGFLVASLIGLVFIPLVHGRAVRLTMRRLEASQPLSMAEIQADKDQLRAEFAMSTRRLEMTVEQLKSRTTSQLAELGKKTEAINRLKGELGEKSATIFALEAREKAMKDQLRAIEEEYSVKTSSLREAERTLADKEAELGKRTSELGERSVTVDSHRVEIVTLRTQVDALKTQVEDFERQVRDAHGRLESKRVESDEATRTLSDERGKVDNLGQRVGGLEQQLIAQTTEAEMLGRRVQDLEARLSEQSRLLTERDREAAELWTALERARKTEADLRAELEGLDGRHAAATEQLATDKAQAEAGLARAREERAQALRDLASLQKEAEETWAAERVESALLRERINDVAAEVARLTATLEGPQSPIEAILAAAPAGAAAPVAPAAANGSAHAEGSGPTGPGGSLAERIRALQSRASRVATST